MEYDKHKFEKLWAEAQRKKIKISQKQLKEAMSEPCSMWTPSGLATGSLTKSTAMNFRLTKKDVKKLIKFSKEKNISHDEAFDRMFAWSGAAKGFFYRLNKKEQKRILIKLALKLFETYICVGKCREKEETCRQMCLISFSTSILFFPIERKIPDLNVSLDEFIKNGYNFPLKERSLVDGLRERYVIVATITATAHCNCNIPEDAIVVYY